MKQYGKHVLLLILMGVLIVFITACQGEEAPPEEPEVQVLVATVLEVMDKDQLLVEPVEGSSELGSADRIVAHTNEAMVLNAAGEKTTIEDYEVGSLVQITYDGSIAESYPAQIWAQKVQLDN